MTSYKEHLKNLIEKDHQWTLEDKVQMLLSEYKAYHIKGNDYWRGIEYALKCLGAFNKEDK